MRRGKLVLKEFTAEPVFCLVLVLIGIFVFSCFTGICNIAMGIDRTLYDFSVRSGLSNLTIMGKWEDLHRYTDEAGHKVYRVICYVGMDDLGADSDYVDKKTGEHRYLSGNVERSFKGGNYELEKMNSCIIQGDPYEYSDNETYSIWLSDICADHLSASVGDTLTVDTGENSNEVTVKGIYHSDDVDDGSDLELCDFYLSAVFLPDYIRFNDLEIVIPELNQKAMSDLREDYFNNGFQAMYPETPGSTLIVKMGIYLVSLFSCIIVISIMVSMTKLYCNKRKGFYSILRLWGLNRFSTLMIIFLFLQILYTISFILALPLAPFVYSGVISSIKDLVGSIDIDIKISDIRHLISYLIFTVCNLIAVVISSGYVRDEDISDSIKMGVEG